MIVGKTMNTKVKIEPELKERIKMLDINNLSDDELVSEIIEGYIDLELGNVKLAKEVFSNIRSSLDV